MYSHMFVVLALLVAFVLHTQAQIACLGSNEISKPCNGLDESSKNCDTTCATNLLCADCSDKLGPGWLCRCSDGFVRQTSSGGACVPPIACNITFVSEPPDTDV